MRIETATSAIKLTLSGDTPVWKNVLQESQQQMDTYHSKETIRYWTLVLGVVQIIVGCGVGFIPPSAVAWFRGIVMAHLEFTANGVLMIVLGLLVRELRLGTAVMWVWFALLQIGTWTNGGAGVLAAFLGVHRH